MGRGIGGRQNKWMGPLSRQPIHHSFFAGLETEAYLIARVHFVADLIDFESQVAVIILVGNFKL